MPEIHGADVLVGVACGVLGSLLGTVAIRADRYGAAAGAVAGLVIGMLSSAWMTQ